MKWIASGIAFCGIGLAGIYILFHYATILIGIVGIVASFLAIACGVTLIVSEAFKKSDDKEDKEVESHVC